MARSKRTKGQTSIYKNIYKAKDREHESHQKPGLSSKCPGRVSSSCSTSGTRGVKNYLQIWW